jgi:hypothetical protein
MKTLARERDKAEVLGRLGAVRPNSVRRWGRMSAHQMVCHLSDGFLMGLGEKPVTRGSRLPPWAIVKWFALYTPVPWPAARIRTSPELDQESQGTRPAEFAADVARLRQLVELFTARGGALEWPSHPIFGRMSAGAWLRWGYLHMDHHLRQFGA